MYAPEFTLSLRESCPSYPSIPLTVVIPAETYKNKVLSTYSLLKYSGAFGPGFVGGTCPCISARPGIRYLSVPSMTMALAGSVISLEGTTSTIRSPSMITVWSIKTCSLSIGITFTLVNTVNDSREDVSPVQPIKNRLRTKVVIVFMMLMLSLNFEDRM